MFIFATNELTVCSIWCTWNTSLTAYTVVEVILFHEHTDKLVAQDEGNNHPGYWHHHIVAQTAYHGKNPGVPSRRGCPHIRRNFPDFAVDLVEHSIQIARYAIAQDALYPFSDNVEDV